MTATSWKSVCPWKHMEMPTCPISFHHYTILNSILYENHIACHADYQWLPWCTPILSHLIPWLWPQLYKPEVNYHVVGKHNSEFQLVRRSSPHLKAICFNTNFDCPSHSPLWFIIPMNQPIIPWLPIIHWISRCTMKQPSKSQTVSLALLRLSLGWLVSAHLSQYHWFHPIETLQYN